MNKKHIMHEVFKNRLKYFVKATKTTHKDLGKVAGGSKQSISGYMKKSFPTAPILTS